MFKSFFENVRKPKNNFGGRVMVKGMNRGECCIDVKGNILKILSFSMITLLSIRF